MNEEPTIYMHTFIMVCTHFIVVILLIKWSFAKIINAIFFQYDHMKKVANQLAIKNDYQKLLIRNIATDVERLLNNDLSEEHKKMLLDLLNINIQKAKEK